MSTFERLLRITLHLAAGGTVSIAWIMQTYTVSHATAKRDFARLEQLLPVVAEPMPTGRGGNPPLQLRMLRGALLSAKVSMKSHSADCVSRDPLAMECVQPDACGSACKCCQRRWGRAYVNGLEGHRACTSEDNHEA